MTTIMNSPNNFPIDAVVAWVDGNDQKMLEKRNYYLNKLGSEKFLGTRPTFFASVNEIKYCVLSIFRFAPFIRNLFIVTDGQDPNIYDDVKRYFPERLSSIRIVDHKEIFRGYEEFLPVFNSKAVETMIWRIEGLAEHFVYFNDDFFLIRDIEPEYWFKNGLPVLRGKWVLAPYKKIAKAKIKYFTNRYLLNKKDYNKFHFFVGQWNSAKLLGMRFRYFLNGHTPYVFRRSTFNEYFSKHDEVLKKNISTRFRTNSQYNVTTLANHLEIINDNKQIEPPCIGYLNPANHSESRFNRRFKRCQVNSSIKSICVQSLDLATNEKQRIVFDWLESLLGFKIDESRNKS